MAIAQLSKKSNSHMSPAVLVECAHELMGGVDVDPATTAFANRLIRAKRIYDYSTNGLNKILRGRCFLNPPGGVLARPRRARDINIGDELMLTTGSRATIWWYKLLKSWLAGDVTQGIFVGFNLEVLRHAQKVHPLFTPLDFPYCIPEDRLCFDRLVRTRKGKKRVAGEQPTHSNIVVYLPETARDVVRFQKVFAKLGMTRPGSTHQAWFWRERTLHGRPRNRRKAA